MKLQHKNVSSSFFDVTIIQEDVDQGNSQQTVYCITAKEGSMAGAPQICVVVGQWESDEIQACADKLLQKIEDKHGPWQQLAINDVCMGLSVKRGTLDSSIAKFKIKFYDQRPSYAPAMPKVMDEWVIQVQGMTQVRDLLNCLLKLKNEDWEDGIDVCDAGFCPQSLFTSEANEVSATNEFFDKALTYYQPGEFSALPSYLKILVQSLHFQKRFFQDQQQLVSCKTCDKPFVRLGSANWKINCMDCWRSKRFSG